MRFDRLRLRNFKPYGSTDLELTDGVTVIHGLNGSGKSSLLEAAFFALYGSAATRGTLADVVTNGEAETDVALWFTHDGESYRIERELRERGDRVTTARCTLAHDGEVIRDGVTDVERFVREMLRMDAEAFVNCAYVKQGQVNKLIEASPADRQRMIDDLLQLGKLEEYRDRAGDARLGVEDVLSERRGALDDLDEQIAEREARDLPAQLNTLESELADVESEIDEYETERDKAESTREEAREVVDEYEQRREELAEVDSRIEEIETKVRETEAEREELNDEIAAAREWIADARPELRERLSETEIADADPETFAARREELDERESSLRESLNETREAKTTAENEARTSRDRAEQHAETATEKRAEADRLEEANAETREELADREERLAEIDDRIEEIESRFADAPVEPADADDHLADVREEIESLREESSDREGELRAARESVAHAEELLDAGNCPECGQEVTDAPSVASLESDRERVAELEERVAELREEIESARERESRAETLADAADELGSLRQNRELAAESVADRREKIADREARIERLRAEADEAETAAEEAREAAAAADERAAEAADRIDRLESELAAVETARDRLDAVEELREGIADREERVERLEERRSDLGAQNDERRERLRELRERRSELAEAVDDERVEQARQTVQQAEEYIEQVDEKLEELATRRDRLTERIGSVRNALDELDDLRDRRETLAARVEALETLHEETTELEATYGDLRAELRRRNVTELERTVNETFELVYANDAYSHIELDGDYGLTVYQKDGQALDPDQLSGGERALFNLSLRCGIYRLLTEGIEGTAPTPPLILDEPTVFLDDGHVSRLVTLVEEMRGFGVRQIVIVSHDDELVGAADDLVHVEKDPTTNRSTARRIDDPSQAALYEPADD